MSLTITFVVVLILILLLFVGARRDLQRGLLALIATLFGAAVSGFWAERWGNELASYYDIGPEPLMFVVGSILLTSIALIIGYGGGELLPAIPRALTWQQRVVGGALGLLNGVILVGYLLHLSTSDNPGFAAIVEAALPVQLLYDGLPVVFLALAIAGMVLILGKSVITAIRRRRATLPPSPPKPRMPTPGAPSSAASPTTAEQREKQQRALDKINDRLR